MPELNDQVLRHIAAQYVEECGLRLQEELAALTAENVAYATPGLDRRVLGGAAAAKRRRNWRVIGAMAAALVLLVTAPLVLRQNAPSAGSSAMPQAAPELAMLEEYAAEEPEADAEAQDFFLEEAAPEDPVTGGGDSGAAAQAAPGENPTTAGDAPASAEEPRLYSSGAYELIPLSFALPEDMEIIRIEQDNARSIYYLSDVFQDHIVLTLEETPRAPDTDGLGEIQIGEHLVYGVEGPDYALLTFHRDGILYEMTCEHDMDTLVRLSYNIL